MIEGLQSFQNVFKIPELKRRVLFTAESAGRREVLLELLARLTVRQQWLLPLQGWH